MLGMILSHIVKKGSLTVIWPDGNASTYGEGRPEATIRLIGRWTPWIIAFHPELKFGETYMDGKLNIEDGSIGDVLEIIMTNIAANGRPLIAKVQRYLRRCARSLMQRNSPKRARANVAHHYDLSGELYDLFLDSDRQYSCAYFGEPKMTLEAAQLAKKRHIAGKLRLDRPGLKVLDIGSGWGGLALDLARDADADVTGVTLSSEQLTVSEMRAQAQGLSPRCRFELTDYRKVNGSFDRIVSVGMFEHVGVNHYAAFFARLSSLLVADGVALLHTIGRSDGPGVTNPWIAKYIFPGGYTPALSEIVPVVERAGLQITDIEILRLHYAETLKEWRARFRRNRAKAAALYDERFCRMWEFYLASCEMAFRHERLVVFQLQLAKRPASLPITRDYMADAERTMRFGLIDQRSRTHEAA